LEQILFFVKFGEREHLQSLANGNAYFSNAGSFIKTEQELRSKGQGDANEGKLFLPSSNVTARDLKTDQVILQSNLLSHLTLGFDGLNTIPAFCVTAGFQNNCAFYRGEQDYRIKFSSEHERTIRSHFPKADSALLTTDPTAFIENICTAFNEECHHDRVRYFDMVRPTTALLAYLLGEKEGFEMVKGIHYSINTENVHNVLFCKDLFFKMQQEYRFLIQHRVIKQPTVFDIAPIKDCSIFALDCFFSGVEVTPFD